MRRLRRFFSDDLGAVAILAGLLLPVVIGGIALGVETSYWYVTQRKLQHAADVAAITGIVRIRAGDTLANVRAAATTVSQESGFSAARGTITVNSPPISGSLAGNTDAIEVVLQENWPRWFSGLFNRGPLAIRGRAVARIQGDIGTACLLALSTTAAQAVQVTGSTSVSLTGCRVASNSVQPTAYSQSNGATVATDCVIAVGGIVSNGNLTMTQPGCPKPNSAPLRDPYRQVAEPALAGPCESKNVGQPNKSTTVTPTYAHPSGMKSMRFCSGLDVKGDVTFMPGLYLIEGGDFTVNGGGSTTTPATLTGSGVTFFVASSAKLKLTGNVAISLSPPTSGPYSGMVFFGSRGGAGLAHVINGGIGTTIQGAVYLPAGNVTYTGNSAATNGCTQVIANTLTLTGSSSLKANCASTGTKTLASELVSLVE